MPKRFALLTLALLVAAPAFSEAAQKETETVDRTVALPANGRLRLKSFSGDVRITGGGGTDVVIHAVRRATRDRLDNIKLEIEVRGDTVNIEANRRASGWRERDDNVVETTFDIKVPSRVELDVDLFSGDVTIEQVDGRQKLHTFSGSLTVRDATAQVDAETFSGNVDLDLSTAPQVPSLNVKTFSGDIRARVPQSGGGSVQLNSFSGNLESEVPLTLHRKSGRNVSGTLGSGDARLEFHTFSGSVRLLK